MIYCVLCTQLLLRLDTIPPTHLKPSTAGAVGFVASTAVSLVVMPSLPFAYALMGPTVISASRAAAAPSDTVKAESPAGV